MPRNDRQEEDHHHGGGRRWELLFWKRVIRAIESAYIADPRLKEVILNMYIFSISRQSTQLTLSLYNRSTRSKRTF
jgi:hypothetical protein